MKASVRPVWRDALSRHDVKARAVVASSLANSTSYLWGTNVYCAVHMNCLGLCLCVCHINSVLRGQAEMSVAILLVFHYNA